MVAAANPLAAGAGREILRAGGNAIDAVIAVQLVLNLVEPSSSGIGGGGFIVFWHQGKRVLTTIDGRETAPGAATPERFLRPDCDCLTNSFRSMAGERRPILYASFLPVTYHARQVQQHGEPRRTLDQRSDGRTAKTKNEITFPVSWHRTVSDFRRPTANHDLGRYEVLASPTCAGSRHAKNPPGTQTGRQFAT
jgi:hypothetical protein